LDILSVQAVQASEYQIANGDFETGDFTGWTVSGDAIFGMSQDEIWWHEWYSFDKDGVYFANGWGVAESAQGSLTSSAFTVGGSGYITFKLGGGKNTDLCRVEIIDAQTGDVLQTFGNTMFAEQTKRYFYSGKPIDLAKDGVYKANMVLYKADLSQYAGRQVRIRLVDEATQDWGLLFADSFITYYETVDKLPMGAVLAQDLTA
jgi:hypothetical protein